jgi:hypothetical protein
MTQEACLSVWTTLHLAVTTTEVPPRPDFLTRFPPKAPTNCLRIVDPTPRGVIAVPTRLSETTQIQESILLMSSTRTKPSLRP